MDDFFYFQYVLAKRLFTSVLKSTRSLGNFEMRQWRVTLRVHLLNLPRWYVLQRIFVLFEPARSFKMIYASYWLTLCSYSISDSSINSLTGDKVIFYITTVESICWLTIIDEQQHFNILQRHLKCFSRLMIIIKRNYFSFFIFSGNQNSWKFWKTNIYFSSTGLYM